MNTTKINTTITFLEKYLQWEQLQIDKISNWSLTKNLVHDKLSGRITLYLIVLGILATVQELYISIEMIFFTNQTYNILNVGHWDDSLKLQKMLLDNDSFHPTEFYDLKRQIIVETMEPHNMFHMKPVHVSQLYVNCFIESNENQTDFENEILFKFNIEFSPDEFEETKRPEFGCTLKNLRIKLYHLIKDSQWFIDLIEEGTLTEQNFTISNNVKIFNKYDELLNSKKFDEIQLCFLKIETGDTIRCDIVL